MSKPFLKTLGLSHPDDAQAAPRKGTSSSPSSTPLGPSVEGPEFDQLYALMSADGSSPLDRSNSKGGAADNLAGEGLVKAFGRLKALEETWATQIDAVKQKAAASEKELAKAKVAAKAFSQRSGAHKAAASQSKEYVKAMNAVKERMSTIEPLIDEADAALDLVDVALEGKEVHEADKQKGEATDALNEAKEKAKEQEELFKSVLGVLGKAASPAEWGEIVVEGLMFVDEQLFAQLPKQKLEELKKRVEEATAQINLHQGKLDAAQVRAAERKLSAAKKRLDGAKEALRDRIGELGMAQRGAAEQLASSTQTADVGKMIKQSYAMQALMAAAKKGCQHYLNDASTLHKQCQHVIDLFASVPGLVSQTPSTDPMHGKALIETAKRDVQALKSWLAYLESMQDEAQDSVRACGDMSDKSYMKNYNQIKPLVQQMLSF